ncbi:hypothetical protein C0J52_19389, partial [Blattella germanica]
PIEKFGSLLSPNSPAPKDPSLVSAIAFLLVCCSIEPKQKFGLFLLTPEELDISQNSNADFGGERIARRPGKFENALFISKLKSGPVLDGKLKLTLGLSSAETNDICLVKIELGKAPILVLSQTATGLTSEECEVELHISSDFTELGSLSSKLSFACPCVSKDKSENKLKI